MVRQFAIQSLSPTQAKVGGSSGVYSACPVYCRTAAAGRGRSSSPKAPGR